MGDRERSLDQTPAASPADGPARPTERESGRIQLAHIGPMALGALRIDPALRQVAHTGGRTEVIEPRVMQVLVALARVEGRILSRDDLLMSCWHGVVVGEDAINRVTGRLRRLLDGVGQGEFKLETITRVGYRLVPAGAVGAVGRPDPSPAPSAGKPSIAVLPFANLSDDPDQDYFADGMVEEIVTGMSRIRSIFVVASGSSLSLKGKSVSLQDAAASLGVRYVLEGSVRKAAGRVRIAVKLIDAVGGGQMWAERFEGSLEDVFALQDKVALAIAGIIEPRLQHAETQRATARPTADIGGYELYLRALALYRSARRETILEALALLERAIELDPAYGLALALTAICHRDVALNGWTETPAEHRRLAVEFADSALRAAGDDAEVLAFAAATLGTLEGDHGAVVALFDRALALNPGSSAAWMSSGMMRLRTGDPDLALEHLETSMRLDPLSPLRGWQLLGAGAARFEQGRFAEAAAPLKESIRLLPAGNAHCLLIACHGHLGQAMEARQTLARWDALGAGPIDGEVSKLWNPRQRSLCEEGLAHARALSSVSGSDAG